MTEQESVRRDPTEEPEQVTRAGSRCFPIARACRCLEPTQANSLPSSSSTATASWAACSESPKQPHGHSFPQALCLCLPRQPRRPRRLRPTAHVPPAPAGAPQLGQSNLYPPFSPCSSLIAVAPSRSQSPATPTGGPPRPSATVLPSIPAPASSPTPSPTTPTTTTSGANARYRPPPPSPSSRPTLPSASAP